MNISAVKTAFAAVTTPTRSTPPTTSTAKVFQTEEKNLTRAKADFNSGRLGVELDRRGQPAKVIYYDESGKRLKSTTFTAENILKTSKEYGIDLHDLTGLGTQLDAAGIGYRPYELYRGTGSDHGVNFTDLIAGGLGSAYDWRKDGAAADKGPLAVQQIAASQALAESLGLTLNTSVTHNRGIDPSYFAPLAVGDESPRTQVMFNGRVASWHRTAAEATTAAGAYQGQVIDLTQKTTAVSPAPATTATVALANQVSTPPVAEGTVAESETTADSTLLAQLQALLAANSGSGQRSALYSLIASLP